MNRTNQITSMVLICSVMGCKKPPETDPMHDVRVPTLREELGITPKTKSETRVGYLSDSAMQHPSLSAHDDYLDLYDAHGNWSNQIVVVFENAANGPTDRTKPIEVKGPIGHMDMGGQTGTKEEYANEVVIVESWRQLDLENVPKKANAEPTSHGDHKSAP